MRKSRSPGSVRGVLREGHSYRNHRHTTVTDLIMKSVACHVMGGSKKVPFRVIIDAGQQPCTRTQILTWIPRLWRYSFTWLIRKVLKWNTDAASKICAPPLTTPS